MMAGTETTMPASSVGGQYHDPPQPPWARTSAVPVPFLTSGAPTLTQAERQALSSLMSSRENDAPKDRYINGARVCDFQGHHPPGTPGGEQYRVGARTPSATSVKAATPLSQQMSFESPRLPPGSRFAAAQGQAVARPSTSPSNTEFSGSSTKSSPAPPLHYHDDLRQARPRHVTALPGTMSARGRAPSRHRTGQPHQNESCPKDSAPDSKSDGRSLRKRLKVALKDIFKRDPIDESSFQRIEGRHWTDEY